MNKEEILKEISKTEEHLAAMKKMLEDCEYQRWEPKKNEAYFYIASDGTVEQDWMVEEFASVDKERYNFYNCFPSKSQAELEAEKILIRRQLEDIARRLNRGERIDWDNDAQIKYSIRFNYYQGIIELNGFVRQQFQGVIYCLDKNFLNTAIKEIGEGRLIEYLRGK